VYVLFSPLSARVKTLACYITQSLHV